MQDQVSPVAVPDGQPPRQGRVFFGDIGHELLLQEQQHAVGLTGIASVALDPFGVIRGGQELRIARPLSFGQVGTLHPHNQEGHRPGSVKLHGGPHQVHDRLRLDVEDVHHVQLRVVKGFQLPGFVDLERPVHTQDFTAQRIVA